MKTAMWAIFIFFLGIVGVVLIDVFGNITTTNQQDYNLVKDIAEAAMLDSIDIASYRAGFYLCTDKNKDVNGKYVFNSKDDYNIILNRNVDLEAIKAQYGPNCEFLLGEVKLKSDVFTESFLRRFSNNINNNKSYQVTVQEVIEYPPKVSVRIDTYNTFNSEQASEEFEIDDADFKIQNQIDAILEDRG